MEQRSATPQATVVAVHGWGYSEEDDRPSLILSNRVMEPASTTMLGDVGWVNDVEVVHVTSNHKGQALLHFEGDSSQFKVGQHVSFRLNQGIRSRQSGLLAAGRLIEVLGPTVFDGLRHVNSDFRPNRAKVEFGAPHYFPDSEWLATKFKDKIAAALTADLSFRSTRFGKAFKVKIGDFPKFVWRSNRYPQSLGQIGQVHLTNVVRVGGRIQVRFRVCDRQQLEQQLHRDGKGDAALWVSRNS